MGRWIVEHPPILVFAKLGFSAVEVFEFLSPLCLVSTWFRRAWIAVMVSFHAASLFVLKIFFWENALLILFFATNCDRLFAPREGEGRVAVPLSATALLLPMRLLQNRIGIDKTR